MFNNAICRQATDQRMRNGIGNRSHQSHAKSHEPEWNSRKQEDFTFESTNAGIAQHQIAVGSDVGTADLEDSSTSVGVGQGGKEVIDHVLNGNRLSSILHP